MFSRQEYFNDLLTDCLEAAKRAGVQPQDEGVVIAALILSDSFNGLRKALLQVPHERRAAPVQS